MYFKNRNIPQGRMKNGKKSGNECLKDTQQRYHKYKPSEY